MNLAGRWIGVVAVGALCLTGSATDALAQPGRVGIPQREVAVASPGEARAANEIRDALREELRRYPPSLGRVLRLDSSLLSNDAYLAPYPALKAFLAQHPEIVRNPEYFLSFVNLPGEFPQPTVGQQNWNQVRQAVEMMAVAVGVVSIALAVLWLIRHLLAHRRWLRATKIQTDLHNRLMERLNSSEDVRHYLETAGTARLLSDVPTAVDGARTAPVLGRIMLAVQIGIVLSCCGLGLLLSKRLINATEEGGMVLVFLGVLTLAVGIGFTFSALASYSLSNRLGLITPETTHPARQTGTEQA